MTLLTACTSMCTAAEGFFGPQVTEWIAIALGLLLGWLKLRKVQATATAGVVAAKAEASKAKESARAAHVQLAEIKGSLRPTAFSLAPTLPPIKPADEGGTSSSGTYQPVDWPPMPDGVPSPRPSMPDPSIAEPSIPRPSAVPREGTTFVDASELDTQPDTPIAKKKGDR